MTKKVDGDGGTGHHVNPQRESFGKAGKVYRYDSGANTHGVSQRAPKNPPETPGGRSDGPYRRGSGREGRGG
jgi:hypothetical protein